MNDVNDQRLGKILRPGLLLVWDRYLVCVIGVIHDINRYRYSTLMYIDLPGTKVRNWAFFYDWKISETTMKIILNELEINDE